MAAKATKTDPFADDTTEPEKTETPDVTVEDAAIEYSVTLKGGRDFDAAWVVMRGTKEQLLEEFDEELQELLKQAAKYGKAFAALGAEGRGTGTGGGAAKRTGGAATQSRPAPGPKDHPNGKKEFCQHGEMQYKSGVTKTGKNAGKTWHAFDCPDGECDRKWDND